MTQQIFAYLAHSTSAIEEVALQLQSSAAKIDAAAPVTAIVSGAGSALEEACNRVQTVFPEVWKLDHPMLEHPCPDSVNEAIAQVLPAKSIVLLSHDHFGIDVGPGLSIKLGAAYAADVIGFSPLKGSALILECQEFGGQVNTHVACDISSGAVVTVRPGAGKPDKALRVDGKVIEKSVNISRPARRRFLGASAGASGAVDITKFPVLVSVGRGIQKAENIPIAEELASTLGGTVSCSRPVVDANWLEKSRQVGTSGATVRPKVYLACGISGQFQHLAGIKGSPLIVAINKNPKAPIFQFADIGVVADLLEFLPALTKHAREAKSEHAGAAR